MKADLTIRNGTLILPSGRVHADLAIQDGVFVAIGAPGTLQGRDHVNASGMIALPGAIDMHVHFREPGATHKEDFWHGTAAAACGGVTTVCDMPNTKPGVTNAQAFAQKVEAIRNSAHVDFGLWAGGIEIGQFPELSRQGAVGLKIYMNRAPAGSQSYSDELSMPDDATLVRVMRAAAEVDWPVCVHVANSSLDEAVKLNLLSSGRRHARDVCLMTRSPESAEAQSRIIHFAKITGARLHIAHISYNSMEALEELRLAREVGVKVTAEVSPPCLNFDDLDRIGAFGTPFAHSDRDNARYMDALRSGIIDVVATDHAPHSREEKLLGASDAWLAPTGYPAVETMLPLLIDAVLKGHLSFERVAAITSENPARICSLLNKGAIAIGNDADFVIVDPDAECTIDEGTLHSKAGWSPFHGRSLRGRVRRTYLRGEEISRDGEMVTNSPTGRPVLIDEQRTRSAVTSHILG